ncbi:hypothetical protein ACFZCV_35325 [Streptomyces sp. NPDC007920]|uniref:hypothetical protein n=1 Tax=Streptomyces sp. NPDC007920 TaxID=3364794 RepID=UPI0036F03F6F
MTRCRKDFTDTIDILPYQGDGRGTSYSGSCALKSVSALSGAKVYYTTADPKSLSDDPEHKSNGAAGTVSGNSAGWSQAFTPGATAVRVIGPALARGRSSSSRSPWRPTVPRAGTNWSTVRRRGTVTRNWSCAPRRRWWWRTLLGLAEEKYVHDASGEWRDANQAASTTPGAAN